MRVNASDRILRIQCRCGLRRKVPAALVGGTVRCFGWYGCGDVIQVRDTAVRPQAARGVEPPPPRPWRFSERAVAVGSALGVVLCVAAMIDAVWR